MIPNPTRDGKVATLRTDRFDCLVDPAFRAVLAERIATDPAKGPEDWTEWTEVKRSTVRSIFRGALRDGAGAPIEVHLKLFRAVRLSDRARDALTGSRAAREFRNLREARARGLPCVRPIAAGNMTGSGGSRSFLLTLTEPGAALSRGPLAADDAAGVGRLLRRVHDAGLHARDLHAGNLLARPDGELLLLDLTSATFGEPLDERERGRALAFFCLDLDGNTRDPAARPLLSAYGASPAVEAAAVQAGRRLRNRALSAFGRRAFRQCRTTHVERTPRKPRVCLHEPARAVWAAARAAVAGLDSAEPVKTGRRGSVHVFDEVVVKERSAAAARRLFESAYWLLFAGVPTPMPVLLQTFQGRGVVVTRRLPGPSLLDELARGVDADTLAACASRFGRSVGRLHSFGLRNRDMKFENLIHDPSTQAIHMVDLDGVRRQLPGDNRGRANDLGRLLAAFRHAGSPGGDGVVRAFLRAYVASCRRLSYPVPHRRFVLDRAERGARAWTAAH